MEEPAARWPGRSGHREGGRRSAGADPRRHRRRPRDRPHVRDRRQLYALRIEPYLIATDRLHADLAAPLGRLAQTHGPHPPRAGARRHQPEKHPDRSARPDPSRRRCAWFGDPAFDLAFCLNHLLLKCLWNKPAASASLRASSSWRRPTRPASNGSPRRTSRNASRHLPAGAAAGAHRRQIAGRIPDFRDRQGPGAADGPRLAAGLFRPSLPRPRPRRPLDPAFDRHPHRRASGPGASGIRAGGPTVEVEVSNLPAAPSASPSRRPGPRPARRGHRAARRRHAARRPRRAGRRRRDRRRDRRGAGRA